MRYLEKFARKRNKEATEVLTARLPESLYHEFKTYCDSLGLSISEAVSLLVEREVRGETPEQQTHNEHITHTSLHTNADKKNDVVVIPNTNDIKKNDVVVTSNTNEYTPKQKSSNSGFVTTPWKINEKLPCPICRSWISATNFSRHAKEKHQTITKEIFTDESYLAIANEMVQDKKRIQ